MTKKMILGTLLFGLLGILLVGAVIRTLDKTGGVAEAQGNGYGRGAGRAVDAGEADTVGTGRDGGGYGRMTEAAGVPAAQAVAPEEWIAVQGTVVQEPSAGVDMILATAEGEEIVVGTGPGYLETQGYALQAGEQVQVQGFWEDGEFKPGTITRLSDGATVQVRDTYGRPAWSGGYSRGAGVTAGTGSGQAATGGYGGEGNTTAPGDGTGTGQAVVDEWVTLEGVAAAVSADEIAFEADSGESVLLDGRALRFVEEQGFAINTGDRLRLTGFYEDGDFEVGSIDNLTTGLSLSIRDGDGRPLWAGRGRRGS